MIMKKLVILTVLYLVNYSLGYDLGLKVPTVYFTEEHLPQKSIRICTQCAENHTECVDEFVDLWNQYGDSDELWSCNSGYTCPWQLSKDFLQLECDYPSKRKKRSPAMAADSVLKHTLFNKSRKRSLISEDREKQLRRIQRSSHGGDAGVIYINKAILGKSELASDDCSSVQNSKEDYCQENALFHRDHLIHYNGEHTSWELGLPSWLQCDGDSDFLQVDYQCIPEDQVARVDHYPSMTSHSGYIMSTNYPYEYTPYCSYQCVITHDHETLINIHLEVLDFHLEERNDSCCKSDWVEVQTINKAKHVVKKNRFCGNIQSTGMLAVQAATIRLLFQTDESIQKRGFWIKYSAYAGDNSTAIEVDLTYSSYDPYDDPFELDDSIDYDDSDCHFGPTTWLDEYSTARYAHDDTTSPTMTTTTRDDGDHKTTSTVKSMSTVSTTSPSDDNDESHKEDDTTDDGDPDDESHEEDDTTPDNGDPNETTTNDIRAEAQSSKSKTNTVGIAVGAAIAGLAVLIAVVLGVCCFVKRNGSAKPAVRGPAFDNPYYSPATSPVKPNAPTFHASPPPLPSTFNGQAVDNPDYNSGYLYPVTSANMGGTNPGQDNTQYEEIPGSSVSSFGVAPTSDTTPHYVPLGNPDNQRGAVPTGGDAAIQKNTQAEANVYQELVP